VESAVDADTVPEPDQMRTLPPTTAAEVVAVKGFTPPE
jgi:hypothetical protein